MTVKTLVGLMIILAALVGTGVYFFQDYLFARLITPGSKNITVSRGEALNVAVGPIRENTTLKAELCSAASGCFPLGVDITEDPVHVRIPIGYQVGPATLQVKETSAQKATRLLVNIPLTIQ